MSYTLNHEEVKEDKGSDEQKQINPKTLDDY